jgi:hypothetical protein
MVKYLKKISDKLHAFIPGMQKNSALWQGQIESEASVKAKLKLVEDKDAEIFRARALLSELYADARRLQREVGKFAVGMEKLAKGLHKDSPIKLVEYGIVYDRTRKHSQPPVKTLAVVLKDDADAEGFIVGIKFSDPDADNYEFEKGISADAADVNHIPPMSYYKVTSKMSFVDDDIQKGLRYWYRVRAINRKGVGPWSDAASRVQ